jgi:hypothetical protein
MAFWSSGYRVLGRKGAAGAPHRTGAAARTLRRSRMGVVLTFELDLASLRAAALRAE